MALAIGAISPTVTIFLMMRVGLVAALVSWFASSFLETIPLTLDMSRFYAPQSLLGTLLLVAIAAYGFRYSLAGRPVFGGLLGDAPPARDTAR